MVVLECGECALAAWLAVRLLLADAMGIREENVLQSVNNRSRTIRAHPMSFSSLRSVCVYLFCSFFLVLPCAQILCSGGRIRD